MGWARLVLKWVTAYNLKLIKYFIVVIPLIAMYCNATEINQQKS